MVNVNVRSTKQRKTSSYGWRTFKGSKSFHQGTDFAFSKGAAVSSWTAGKVVAVGNDGHKVNRGKYIIIEAAPGVRFSYHSLHTQTVKVGQTVKQWQTIGTAGDSANSTGSHLHVGLWLDGVHKNVEDYVKLDGVARSVSFPTKGTTPAGGGATSSGKVFIDGKFGAQSITALQIKLKGLNYTIQVDGKAASGGQTWKRFQQFLQRRVGIITKIDGVMGAQSIRALQTWLQSIGEYKFKIDGSAPAGGETWKGLQRALNRPEVWYAR